MLLLVTKGERSFDKHGTIKVEAIDDTTSNIEKTLPEEQASSTGKAGLRYRAFKKNKVQEWWRNILSKNKDKVPSAEQLLCIKAIVNRCEQEARDEQSNVEYRSEPLRLILHGVPGVQVSFVSDFF